MQTQWYHFNNPIKTVIEVIWGIWAWGKFRP